MKSGGRASWREYGVDRKTEIPSLLLGRARNPQLLHLVGQGRPLEARASCRATSTSDNPIALAKRSQNLLSLGLLQHTSPARCTEDGVVKNFSQGHSQR